MPRPPSEQLLAGGRNPAVTHLMQAYGISEEAAALRDLDQELAQLPADAEPQAIQHLVFEVGKRHPFDNLRAWFQALYETLLGSSQGPRMGSFIALYGIDNSRRLIAEALAGGDS